MTAARQAALSEIVRLAREHHIDADEIAANLTHAPAPERQKGLVGRLFNYIGGIFVFAGICVLVSMIWDDIGSAQRVIVTFGTGLCAFILGMTALKDPRFEKAATPLFLVSALLQPTGIFVFLKEYLPETGDPLLAATLVFAVMTAQQGLAFLQTRRTSLLFLAMAFWNFFLGTAMAWLDMSENWMFIMLGFAMLSVTWGIGRTPHRAITPFWYLIGGVMLLSAWWEQFEGTILDLSFLGVSAFLVYLAIAAGSRSLLFISVLGLLGYLGYFAEEYFADVVGWPICLIVLGFAMMGLSAYALKLGQKIAARGRP